MYGTCIYGHYEMKFGKHNRPSRVVIRKLIDKFFRTSWEVLADNNDDIDLRNLGYQQYDASSHIYQKQNTDVRYTKGFPSTSSVISVVNIFRHHRVTSHQ